MDPQFAGGLNLLSLLLVLVLFLWALIAPSFWTISACVIAFGASVVMGTYLSSKAPKRDR